MDEGLVELRSGLVELPVTCAVVALVSADSGKALDSVAIERMRATGAVRIAKLGSAPEAVMGSFVSPLEAVEAALRIIRMGKGLYAAGVLTGTAKSFDESIKGPLASRAVQIANLGEADVVALSLATYELTRESLPEQVTVEELGTFELANPPKAVRIFHLRYSLDPKSRSQQQLKGGSWRTTCFIGRAKELDKLKNLVERSRLVSILGAPGIGKSSLLERLCHEAGERFLDGVIGLDLSAVGNDTLVVSQIVRLLGIQKRASESYLRAIVNYFSNRSALLALDGCDRVYAGTREVVQALLSTCSEVQIVYAGQKALRLPAEARFPLEGLEVPSTAENWQSIAEYDSVALFTDRAQLVHSNFRVTSGNASSLARLCLELDGNPLAIEIAASKVRTLSPRQLLHRLEDRFALLREPDSELKGPRMGLWKTFDWSANNLSQSAQILLRRLGIFDGAFSVDSAAAVCTDDWLPKGKMESAVEELTDASFLQIAPGELERRFVLSATVRHYARIKLKLADEEAEFRRRRLQLCVRWAATAGPLLYGSEYEVWLDRIDAHYPDFEGVIKECLGRQSRLGDAAKIVIDIHRFWFFRNYYGSGLQLIEQILRDPRAGILPETPQLVSIGSQLAAQLGEWETAHKYAKLVLRLARDTNAPELEGLGWNCLGTIALLKDRMRTAVNCYRRALARFEQTGDTERSLLLMLNMIVPAAQIGAGEWSLALAAEAEKRIPRDQIVLQAYLHGALGWVRSIRGEYEQGLSLIEGCEPTFTQMNNVQAIVRCLRTRSACYAGLGEYETSARLLGRARYIVQEHGFDPLPYEAKFEQGIWERLSLYLPPAELDELLLEGAVGIEPEKTRP